MTQVSMPLLIKSFMLLGAFRSSSQAFVATERLMNLSSACELNECKVISPSSTFCVQRLNRLHYRNHDEEDDDSAMSQLRTRAAPTFKKSEVMKPAELQAGESSPSNAPRVRSDGINKPLVFSLFLNQFLIFVLGILSTAAFCIVSGDHQFLSDGILNWSDALNPPSSSLDFSLTLPRLMMGIFGALPAILLSTYIERSDDRRYATTNFSTIFMVMTLFGRRKSAIVMDDNKVKMDRMRPLTNTIDVALLAATLSAVTGFVEEITFRGALPHVLKSMSAGNTLVATIGQAGFFALGHTSPKTSLEENITVGGIQFLNGLWMGVLYHITGGDVVPCIIAHALYDFQVIFFTWITANDQIEYAFQKSLEPVPSDSLAEVRAMQRQFGTTISDKNFEMCKRVFYIFDSDKNGAISRSEAQRGVSYMEAEGLIVAPSQTTVNSIFNTCIKMRSGTNKHEKMDAYPAHQLRFADFVRLFLTIKAVSASLAPFHPKFRVV